MNQTGYENKIEKMKTILVFKIKIFLATIKKLTSTQVEIA
jgi:hypothetical protein